MSGHRPLRGTIRQCAEPSCNFTVMFTDSGWCHTDTHGQDTSDHAANPQAAK
jgi:hypothetical protein